MRRRSRYTEYRSYTFVLMSNLSEIVLEVTNRRRSLSSPSPHSYATIGAVVATVVTGLAISVA
jgi:hypothetical protein